MMNDLLTELQCTQPPAGNCYRLIILGSGRVGKTAIVKRFLSDDFTECYIPTIEDFHRKIYKIHNDVYQLDIVDTSGIHPFPAMRRLSFLTGDAFILVYSIDSRESYEEALRLREQILESIRSAATGNKSKSGRSHNKNAPTVPMIIAGNKSDKAEASRVVSTAEVEHMLGRFKDNVAFIECSAKDNTNIAELFESLFVMADFPDEMIPNAGRRISLTHGGNVLINDNNTSKAGNQSAASRLPLQRAGQRGDDYNAGANGSYNKNHNPAMRHGITLRRRLSDAYSALITNVRRPSIKADLIMVSEKRQQPGGAGGRVKNRKKRSVVHRAASAAGKSTGRSHAEREINGTAATGVGRRSPDDSQEDVKKRHSCFKRCWS
ncbi:GTP-binding protein Rhes-like [Paramacrobiotus metropolitanus]|uniref:GTP-binding protein Rhes-like n=1 Tax=Paramacrobiotus metropolitanus TaxID=2943436 RepID=UPI002445F5AF|nr:GTP-binding protein Rhes-like [Paramacrobiotus metropolitanus]